VHDLTLLRRSDLLHRLPKTGGVMLDKGCDGLQALDPKDTDKNGPPHPYHLPHKARRGRRRRRIEPGTLASEEHAMQTALRLNARVQAGHKLEIVAPELTEGEEVTILVTPAAPSTFPATPLDARAAFARHLLETGAIATIPPGRSGPPPRPIAVHGRAVSETIIEERG